jgi:lysyl-tRNA synthetase class I
MEPKHLKHIRSLYKFLSQKNNLNKEEFTHLLYQIPKKPDATNEYNKKEQLDFFKNIYHLLLGKDSGPRLVPFLMDADRQYVLSLLNI